ncbi:uncharacterized protein MYCFIDRAFT_71126 [Pseudocercospora fijiensis CIRAD86]|uniref:Uncharacterized protein n=1 Tax=Pseudocercospora fijiensis (strain CIRAD86) TaxID=383855 RepID=M2Z0A0_PSEFD|nr:uncharacterized protein MYCFIDRAFT_71126 [Pseudocercospora fijiensis CIRAD86]EME83250.1 hypothetical protein MYCFIDRAFT_71126 [Pseudocercospora fijiensis CIRAD86]
MAIPIILCGVSEVMGTAVTQRLRPEVEVLQFINSASRAKAEIPAILAGKAPSPNPDENIGSHDFSKRPAAVAFGRGFELQDVKDIRAACQSPEINVAWLCSSAVDIANTKASPPNLSDPKTVDGYAASIAALVKDTVNKVMTEGKGTNEIYNY